MMTELTGETRTERRSERCRKIMGMGGRAATTCSEDNKTIN